MAQMTTIAGIMNELHAKGYRFVANGVHLPNEGFQPMQYMVFEKK